MTRRERVAAAISHRQPDKVPLSYQLHRACPGGHGAVVRGSAISRRPWATACSCWKPSRRAHGATRADEIWEDQFGVQWDRTIDADIGTVCNSPLTPQNLTTYPFPDPLEPSRFEDWDAQLAGRGDVFVVANIGFSLFERAWTLAGMETVLIAMADDKRFLNELLDRILDFNLKLIDTACGFPIDGMRFGDDWGQQRGLIMGPTCGAR